MQEEGTKIFAPELYPRQKLQDRYFPPPVPVVKAKESFARRNCRRKIRRVKIAMGTNDTRDRECTSCPIDNSVRASGSVLEGTKSREQRETWSTEARSNRTAELFRTVDTSHVVVRWAAVSRTTTPCPPYLCHPTPPPADPAGVRPPWPLPPTTADPLCRPSAPMPANHPPSPRTPAPFANHRAYSTSSPA
ncbi:hypothetical protein KM043_004961 [Ampulex compressa]|nr:hypothetical protein KM043_004961 [Ampulex compressa]